MILFDISSTQIYQSGNRTSFSGYNSNNCVVLDYEYSPIFLSPPRVAFSRVGWFSRARVSLSLLSLRKNGGLLVV